MNRLSTRIDDLLRLRQIVPGFGGGRRCVSDLRAIAWACAGASDAELLEAAMALMDRADVFARLGSDAGIPIADETLATTVALRICHVPDAAMREALKSAFCSAVQAIAGRPVSDDRRRRRA
jgi:hypothetical protein